MFLILTKCSNKGLELADIRELPLNVWGRDPLWESDQGYRLLRQEEAQTVQQMVRDSWAGSICLQMPWFSSLWVDPWAPSDPVWEPPGPLPSHNSNTGCPVIASDPADKCSAPQDAPTWDPVTSLWCFWPTSCRCEAPRTPSSGSTNLLEQLTELTEAYY